MNNSKQQSVLIIVESSLAEKYIYNGADGLSWMSTRWIRQNLFIVAVRATIAIDKNHG
jgi:hypothetical protein